MLHVLYAARGSLAAGLSESKRTRCAPLSSSARTSGPCRGRCKQRFVAPTGGAASTNGFLAKTGRPFEVTSRSATDEVEELSESFSEELSAGYEEEEEDANGSAPFWMLSQKDKQLLTQLGTCAMAALAEPILGSVDTICIGRLGVIPMAAMTPNNTVFNMLNTLASLTMSVTVVSKMSAAIGAGRRRVEAESSSDEKKNQSKMMSTDSAFDAGATSALVLGIASAAAFLLLPEFCLTATGASIETLAPAKSYFVIRALGVPVFLVTMVLNAAYTAALDLRTPLLNVVGAGLLNAVLDMIFIFGFGWGLPGAAAATVIAQYVAGGMLLSKALGPDRAKLHLQPLADWRLPPMAAYRDFLGHCFLGSGRAVVVLAVWAACNIAATRLGSLQAASHLLLFQYMMFPLTAMNALLTVGNSQVSHAVNSGGMDAARQVSNRLLLMGGSVACAMSSFTWLCRGVIPRLFTTNVVVHSTAAPCFVPCCLMLALAWLKVPEAALLGTSDTRFLSWCYLPAALTTALQLWNVSANNLGLLGVWYAMCTFYGTLMVLFMLRWYQREATEDPLRWARRRVLWALRGFRRKGNLKLT